MDEVEASGDVDDDSKPDGTNCSTDWNHGYFVFGPTIVVIWG